MVQEIFCSLYGVLQMAVLGIPSRKKAICKFAVGDVIIPDNKITSSHGSELSCLFKSTSFWQAVRNVARILYFSRSDFMTAHNSHIGILYRIYRLPAAAVEKLRAHCLKKQHEPIGQEILPLNSRYCQDSYHER